MTKKDRRRQKIGQGSDLRIRFRDVKSNSDGGGSVKTNDGSTR